METKLEDRPLTTKAQRPLPRFRRAAEPPPLVLQPRDLALLHDLDSYRLLTTSQLETARATHPEEALRFVSRLTLTRRLKLLFHHGYVRRLARPSLGGMEEPVYLLDKEGVALLNHLDGGERRLTYPSQTPRLAALDHRLMINDCRLALMRAQQQGHCRLVEWHEGSAARFSVNLPTEGTASKAHAGKTRKVTLIPDGAFTLRVRGMRCHYFLEVDRGTEVGRILTEKGRAYREYWSSGDFADQYDVPRGVGFRVLLVAPTDKRAATIRRALHTLRSGRSLFLTTRHDLVMEPGLHARIFALPGDGEERLAPW